MVSLVERMIIEQDNMNGLKHQLHLSDLRIKKYLRAYEFDAVEREEYNRQLILKQMKRVLYNAIRTPDGTVIVSTNRHDFVSHTDANGQYYAVDGGSDYSKRVYDTMDYTEISVYDDGKWETRREYLRWGRNYDKDMNRLLETEWILIKDLATDHIEAILDGGFCNDEMYLETFNEELKNR